MNVYLELPRQGRTGWRRYVLAVMLILFLWQIVGALPSIFLFIWVLADGKPQTGVLPAGQFVGVETILSFVAAILASVFFFFGIYLAIRYIHQRPFRSLITPLRAVSWRRFIQGFLVWFVISGLISMAEVVLYPGRYAFTLDWNRFIPFAFLALFLVPIQTSAEELFFRGYVMQGFGLMIRNIWILSAISGLIFMLPHFLNPEARVNYGLMGFYYFFIGAVMAYVTLRDGRLELALGLHAANNLFSTLIANYTITVLPSPSIFTIGTLDAVFSVLAAIVGLVLFVLVFIGSFQHALPGEDLSGSG